MTRYALRLQNAVSIAIANILHSVDFFFRWEYGWMLALETKKLAHSDRLLLLLSKTIPAPSPSTLVKELSRQVKRAAEAAQVAREQPSSIRLDTFDNVSTAFGYQRK